MLHSRTKVERIALCGLFAALMAAGAYIKIIIPLGVWQVTVSLQLFFALLSGLLLPANLGAISVLIYLIIGLLGVPVFAYGGGFSYIARPTFGFLLGFLAAAFVTGKLMEVLPHGRYSSMIISSFTGTACYYIIGLIYYYLMFNYVLSSGSGIGLKELLLVYFCSTAIPDFILSFLSAFSAMRLKARLKYIF